MIDGTHWRALGHLALYAGRRVLAFGQTINPIIEQNDVHVQVTSQAMDEVIATDTQRITIARYDPNRQLGRVSLRPVAIAGARPWIECTPYVLT